MTISKLVVSAVSPGAALGVSAVLAADPPAAKSADEALTCEQIYVQVTAETQREQQGRAQRNEDMRRQGQATKALLTAAALTGGMGGTAQAAQHTVEAGTDKQMAMATAPPPNPRKERLKQLWAAKNCVRN